MRAHISGTTRESAILLWRWVSGRLCSSRPTMSRGGPGYALWSHWSYRRRPSNPPTSTECGARWRGPSDEGTGVSARRARSGLILAGGVVIAAGFAVGIVELMHFPKGTIWIVVAAAAAIVAAIRAATR